jgi:hypothetical protein
MTCGESIAAASPGRVAARGPGGFRLEDMAFLSPVFPVSMAAGIVTLKFAERKIPNVGKNGQSIPGRF